MLWLVDGGGTLFDDNNHNNMIIVVHRIISTFVRVRYVVARAQSWSLQYSGSWR